MALESIPMPIGELTPICGIDIPAILRKEKGMASLHDSGAFDSTSDPHQDDLEQPLSHDGHDGRQQQQSRKGDPVIDQALYHQVHFPPQESGNAADQEHDEHIERGRGQTDP